MQEAARSRIAIPAQASPSSLQIRSRDLFPAAIVAAALHTYCTLLSNSIAHLRRHRELGMEAWSPRIQAVTARTLEPTSASIPQIKPLSRQRSASPSLVSKTLFRILSLKIPV